MRARRLFGLCAVFFGACAPANVIEVPTEDAEAIVVIGDAVTWAVAVDEADRPFVTVPRPADPERALLVADYGCPLSGLGLDEGRVQLVESQQGFALPPPRRVRAIDRAGDATQVEAPRELTDLRFAGAPPETSCRALTAITQPRPRGDPLSIFLPAGDEVLVSPVRGYFSLVDREGSIREMLEWQDGPAFGGALTSGGLYYLIGVTGRTARGRLFAPLEPLPDFTGRPPLKKAWIDASDGPGLDVVALSDSGSVAQLDEQGWTIAWSSVGTATITRGGIASIGPGEAFVLGPPQLGDGELGRVMRGQWSVERLSVPQLAMVPKIVSLTRLGPGRIAAGTARGHLLLHEAGAWRLAAMLPDESSVLVVAELDGGFLLGGAGGRLVQVHADGASCPLLSIASVGTSEAPSDLQRLIAVERGLVAQTDPDDPATEVDDISRITPGALLRIPRCDPSSP